MFGDLMAKNGGFITFTDYAQALSSLLRGTIEEKIRFVIKEIMKQQQKMPTADFNQRY